MATAAFLLAPISAVPHEPDHEWASRYNSWNWRAQEVWESISERLPPAERAAVNAFGAMRTTSNFASLHHLDDRGLRRSARSWVEESYRRWLAAGRPHPPPDCGPADFEAATGIPSGISLGDLLYYRGGFRKLPARSLPEGVALGYLSNKGDIDEFSLGSATDFELTRFSEIARAHGGEHLALWTYGHAAHLWHARSSEPGTTPITVRASFRLRHPGASPRDPTALTRLRTRLRDGVFAPDWHEIDRQLAAEEISVTRLFEAFGVSGASEIVPSDREAVWSEMERVCLDLFSGRTAEMAAVRRLNKLIRTIDEESGLWSKPRRRGPIIARRIADAVHTLTEAIGPAEDPLWQARERAANSYWDITDCAALERLTVGSDSTGFGDSASLGRLLLHYPVALARDPIFLAMAALQAEAANGHAFVEPLQILAVHAAEAGFTLAVYASDHDDAFRSAFGIEAGADVAHHPSWVAHAFIDLPGRVTGDVRRALNDWFAAEGCDGHLLRGEPDGTFEATGFRAGQPQPDSAASDTRDLERASIALDPRAACLALGLPDLLEPGAWQEGAYDGSAAAPSEDEQRPFVEAALRRSTPPLEIASWDELFRWRTRIRYRGDKPHWEDGIVSLGIATAAIDPEALEAIRRDLLCADLIEDYGNAWIDAGRVRAYTRTDLDLCLLGAVLADAPRPIDLVFDLADEGHSRFRLVP